MNQPPDRLLAIETADRHGSIAAARIGPDRVVEVCALELLEKDRRSAQSLAPAIEELLRSVDWNPLELDYVAVTVGPGSFTGLRVGVATAKTLAYAAQAKVVAVNTLAALATPALSTATGRVWAAIDAQRQEAFVAAFAPGIDPATVATGRAPVSGFLKSLRPGDTVISPMASKLATHASWPGNAVRALEAKPTADAVALLAGAPIAAGTAISPFDVTIDYCRPSAAEEKLGAPPG